MKYICSLFLLAALSGFAQVSHTVNSTGTTSVSVTPDQAQISISAVTTAISAQDAANQNATLATNIQSALTQAIGTSGTIQTVGYSVNPNYNNQGTLTGYTVTNSIQVTLNDLSITGRIIDTATQAGASRINSLSFSLKDNTNALTQALKAATLQAKAKADAMASSVGLKTGAFLVIQESGTGISQPISLAPGATAATPITAGQLNVTGNVTIEVQLQQ